MSGKNPDIPRAGLVGAPGGAAERGRARLGANRIIRSGNKSPPFLPRRRRNVASMSPQKHEQAKSHVNRRRNKITGWPAVYPRFIRGLSAGWEALFVPGCRPVERRLFVSINPFHARYVREPTYRGTPQTSCGWGAQVPADKWLIDRWPLNLVKFLVDVMVQFLVDVMRLYLCGDVQDDCFVGIWRVWKTKSRGRLANRIALVRVLG